MVTIKEIWERLEVAMMNDIHQGQNCDKCQCTEGILQCAMRDSPELLTIISLGQVKNGSFHQRAKELVGT